MRKLGKLDAQLLWNRTSYKNVDGTSETPLWYPWTTMCSELHPSALHLLGCRLVWVRCLFDPFNFEVFVGKWWLNIKFSKIPSNTFQVDMDSRFVAKFGENHINCWEVAEKSSGFGDTWKTLALRESSKPPILPKYCTQNFLNVVTPPRLHVYWIWSRLAVVCQSYSRKTDFLDPISDYNIGWKPSIKIRITKVSTVHNKRLNLAYILLTYAYTKSIFLIDILKVYKLVANAVAAGSLFQSDTTRTGNEWARALILASGYNNFSGDPCVLLQLAN